MERYLIKPRERFNAADSEELASVSTFA